MSALYTEPTSKGVYTVEHYGAGYYAILFKTLRQKKPRLIGNGRSLEAAKAGIELHKKYGTTRPDLLRLDQPGIHRLSGGRMGLGRIDVTKHFKRERQMSPKACAVGSFRAKKIKGRLLTFCCPKGHWSRKSKRCKVGMKLQSFARPRR